MPGDMKGRLTLRLALLVAAVVVVAFVVRLYLVVDQAPETAVANTPPPVTPVTPTALPLPLDAGRSDSPTPTPAPTPTPTPATPTPATPTPEPEPDPDPRFERDRLVGHIRDNLVGHEAWNAPGLAILDAAAKRATSVTDRGCYMAGCIAVFTFPTEDAYEHAAVELTESAAYTAWTGGKQVTPPEIKSDGSIVIAVALLRPD